MDLTTEFLSHPEYNTLPTSQELAVSELVFSRELGTMPETSQTFAPLSVTRLHRHFDLQQGEVPVWRTRPGGFELGGAPTGTHLLPITWIPEESGLKAVEYIDASSDPERAQIVRELLSSSQSLHDPELLSAVRALGKQGPVGVTLLPNYFAGKARPANELVFVEYEAAGSLLKKTEIVSLPCRSELPFGVTTTWSPTPDGGWEPICHCGGCDRIRDP